MRWYYLLLAVPLLAADPTAEALVEAGHYKRALALLNHADPKDAAAQYLLSHIKEAANQPDAALQLADKTIQLESANARYHAWTALLLAMMTDKAGVLRQVTLGRRCKKEMETALQLDPSNTDALRLQLLMYLHAPAVFGGDKVKARETAARMTRIDPAAGPLAFIEIARDENHESEVEGLYRKSLAAKPSSYDGHIRLARYSLSRELHKPEQAEAEAREAIRIDNTRVNAYWILARALVRQAKWTELDAAIAAAEQAVPDNIVPYYTAADECVIRGEQPDRARRYLSKYLTAEPEIGEPTHAQAQALLAKIH